MNIKRFSVAQIVAMLKHIDLGMPMARAARQLGVFEQTMCRKKNRHADLESDHVRVLKVLR